MKKIDVGILGGTGMVGQHFIRFLQGHPWFNLTWLGASDRSAGKKLKDATSWRLDGDIPSSAAEIVVSDSKPSAKRPAADVFGHGRCCRHGNRTRFRASRTHYRFQFAQPSHGSGCSSHRTRGQSRSLSLVHASSRTAVGKA